MARKAEHPTIAATIENAIRNASGDDLEKVFEDITLQAVVSNDTENIQRAIDGGLRDDIVDWRGPNGETYLHLAAHAGSIDVVKLLLAAGFDPCVTTDDGVTPEETAAVKGNDKIAKLLQQAAKAFQAPATAAPSKEFENTRNEDDGSMSTTNSSTQDADTVTTGKALTEDEVQNYRALLDAIREGDLAGVRAACDRYPSVVSFMKSDGQQALHVAAQIGDPKIVEALIAKGADVLAEVGTIRKYDDGLNKLPVEVAAEHGHAEVVDLLNATIEAQIAKDPDFRFRALTLAAERGALGEVVRIVALDPSMAKRQDGQGWTPLLIAVSNSHKDVVCHLLNEGADIYQWVRDDPKFFTPFDLAMDIYDSEISQILRAARERLEEEENEGG